MGLIMRGVGTRGVATIYPDTNLILASGGGGQTGGSSNSFTLVDPIRVGDLVLLISSAPNVSQAVWDSALLTEVTDQGSPPNLNIQHSLVVSGDTSGRYAGPTRNGLNTIITPNIIPIRLFYRKAVFDQAGTRSAATLDNNPVTVTGITTSVDNCKLLLVMASTATGLSTTPPPGWELEIDGNPGIFSGRLVVFKRIQAQAGATGSVVFTGNPGVGATTVGIMLSIKPPALAVSAIITGSMTVGFGGGGQYGYNSGGGVGSMTSNPAGIFQQLSYNGTTTVLSLANGSFTGPQGAVTVVVGVSLNGSSTCTVTVDGISQQFTFSVMGNTVNGDPFNLAAKNGQTLAVSIVTP